MAHYHCKLSMHTVTVHRPCALSMLSLSTVTVHGTLYSGTVRCHGTLHTATAHCHYTLSLYTVTVHCTRYTVHCTLYTVRPKVSLNMYPHTQYVCHNAQVSILALYTVTLHSLYALTIHCHCKVSLYTVTVNLVRFCLGRGWMVI